MSVETQPVIGYYKLCCPVSIQHLFGYVTQPLKIKTNMNNIPVTKRIGFHHPIGIQVLIAKDIIHAREFLGKQLL